jgi:hypothetical protein
MDKDFTNFDTTCYTTLININDQKAKDAIKKNIKKMKKAQEAAAKK